MPLKKRVWSGQEKLWMQENLRYDPDTGHLWWTVSGPRRRLHEPAGAVSNGTISIGTTLSTSSDKIVFYKAHHIAWFLYYGETVDYIDHIDNNPFNNKIENLRVATHQANLLNRKPWSKSGFKGVTKSGSKWEAGIVNRENGHGGRLYLGSFDTPEEAAYAFDKKCEEYKRRYPELAMYFVTNKDLGLI